MKQKGTASSADAAVHSAAFANWHPSKSPVGQCIKQDLFEMEMLRLSMDFFFLSAAAYIPPLMPRMRASP